jgi:isoleucyl-tRNA synthetase
VEGSDQHRGWFQSSLLTRVMFDAQAPFSTIVSHGFVLDEKLQKMSKSLGNVILPKDAIAKAGSIDAFRLWACMSDSTLDTALGQSSLATASDTLRKVRNVLRFLLSVCESEEEANVQPGGHPLDDLLLAELGNVLAQCRAGFDKANVRAGLKPALDFINGELLTVYIDQSKDRLYCEDKSSLSRQSCVETIRSALVSLASTLAPILVFTCDELLAHGQRTFKGKSHLTELRIRQEYGSTTDDKSRRAVQALLDARQALNKLLIKDEDRGRACIKLGSSDATVREVLTRLNTSTSLGPQWTPLAEALQVRRLEVVPAAVSMEAKLELLDDKCKKCERCRKSHESVHLRETAQSESAEVCDRCYTVHSEAIRQRSS